MGGIPCNLWIVRVSIKFPACGNFRDSCRLLFKFFEAEEAESHRWRSRQGIQSTREWLGCQ